MADKMPINAPKTTSFKKCWKRYILEIPPNVAKIILVIEIHLFPLYTRARKIKSAKAAAVCPEGKLFNPIFKTSPSTGTNSWEKPLA